MDELLKQILAELQELKQGQQALEQGQKGIVGRLETLEQGQQTLEQGQQALEQGQQTLSEKVGCLEKSQHNLHDKLDLFEKRTMSQFKTLEQRLEELEVKNGTRHMELQTQLNMLEGTVSGHGSDLALLKQVK